MLDYLIEKQDNPNKILSWLELKIGKIFLRGVLRTVVVLPLMIVYFPLSHSLAKRFSGLVDNPILSSMITVLVFLVNLALLIAVAIFMVGNKPFLMAIKLLKEFIALVERLISFIFRKVFRKDSHNENEEDNTQGS